MISPVFLELKPTIMKDIALHMDRKPFNGTTDPHFFFVTDGVRKVYKNIVMSIATKRPLMTISGDSGTGKTTLIHYLMEKTSPAVKWLYLSQALNASSDLFVGIGSLLGAPITKSKPSEIQEYINKHLINASQAHDAIVAVIDEAQSLSKEIIAQVIHWQYRLKSRNIHLSLLFSGLPSFYKDLYGIEAAKKLIHPGNGYHLSAMTFDESCQMIVHRLKKAGYTGPPLFRVSALNTIFQLSCGNPRRVISICDLVIYAAAAHFGRTITAREVHDISNYIFRIKQESSEKYPIDSKSLPLKKPFKKFPTPGKIKGIGNRNKDRQKKYFFQKADEHRKMVSAIGRKVAREFRKNRFLFKLPSLNRMKKVLSLNQQLFWPYGWVACYLLIITFLGYAWLSPPSNMVSLTTANAPISPEKSAANPLNQPLGFSSSHASLDIDKNRDILPITKKSKNGDKEKKGIDAKSGHRAIPVAENEFGYQTKKLAAPLPSRALASFSSVNAAFKNYDRQTREKTALQVIKALSSHKKPLKRIAVKTPIKPPVLINQLRSLKKPPTLSEAIKPRQALKSNQPSISVKDLASAIGRGDMVALSSYMNSGIDPNSFISKDHSLLTAAVENGSLELVRFLVNKGARVDLLTPAGETALMKSTWMGNEKMARWLLSQDAQVNLQNQEGWTSLFYAAIQGRTEVVDLLLDHGANLELTDEFGRTPLMAASWNGHGNVVERLLASGADTNRKDRDGWTALMFAAFQGHAQVGEILILSGARLSVKNNKNQTSAELANKQGHIALYTRILSFSNGQKMR